MDVRYGRARCPRCDTWYDIDEGHTCAAAVPAAAFLRGPIADAATVPDPDRPHPAGLTWVSPLTPRPIPLGPSEDHPELRPALAIAADRFWTHAGHGLAVGRSEVAFDAAVAAAPSRAYRLRVAETADAWDRATTNYAKELAS
jgi:hypothetical protein